MKQISVLGIPWDNKSSFLKGSAKAPDRIRKILNNGASNFHSEDRKYIGPGMIEDFGNINISNYNEMIPGIQSIILKAETPFIFLGGDHSVTYPIIKALNKKIGGFHMLHIDAHADLYEEYEGDRFSHACPMARIMEEGLALSMTQVGIRTMNDHQEKQANRFGVKIIEMKDWKGQNLQFQGPLYITLDMDAFDPGFAPGVSHHEPGGFSPRQIIELIQNIQVPIIAADIVELNPDRDIHDMTAALACKMFKELASKMIP